MGEESATRGTKEKSAAQPTADRLAEVFAGNYERFQYAFIEFMAPHLADVAREFRGDLQPAVILAILGQRRLRWAIESRRDGAPPAWAPTMTASRLADTTGIPRETVRRKLALLVDRGWLERAPDGGFAIVAGGGASQVREDLVGLDRRGLERAARFVAALRDLG